MNALTSIEADLSATLSLTHWIVMVHYGDLGVGMATDPQPSFTDACNQYADKVAEGYSAQVWQMSFAEGALKDVTQEAIAKILSWHGRAA
jgi:hypothetical protein